MTDFADVPKPESLGELTRYLKTISGNPWEGITDYGSGEATDAYNLSVKNMVSATLATWNWIVRVVGPSGFQGEYAALEFYQQAMHVNGPFRIERAEDFLYPQLMHKQREFIDGSRDWLREQAQKHLAEANDHVHPAVKARWEHLAQ